MWEGLSRPDARGTGPVVIASHRYSNLNLPSLSSSKHASTTFAS